MVDAEAVKDGERAAYASGDYSWLSRWFMPAAGDLVEAVGVKEGDDVLDVAAGDGNVSVAAARQGARVTAVDLSPQQVAAGEARTSGEGLAVTWQVGDAESLTLPNESFDFALSTFGVMYVPRPELAVSELFRVLRPGGTVGVVSWPPDGFNARLAEAASAFIPPEEDDDGPDPDEWGDPVAVAARLGVGGATVDVSTGSVAKRATSASAFWLEAAAHVPVLQAMRGMLSAEDFEAFGQEYQRITTDCSRRDGDGILIELEYTRAIARRAP